MIDTADFYWRKMKNKDIPTVEKMLRGKEETCVNACGRFLRMAGTKDQVWMLCKRNNELTALVIYSRTTLMPVLCGIKKIPYFKLLNNVFTRKKIHSIQGLPDEAAIIEKEMLATRRPITDIFNFDLMSLDHYPFKSHTAANLTNLIIRKPVLNDVEALLPLRKGYEEEEVLPRNSFFSADAARVMLANFITYGRILVAELNGKIVGKIVVNAVSFTRYQIGGVFVLPEYRGNGIAGRMTHEFVTGLINEGRGVTLFVKKENIPARRLYASLGFVKKYDYRITYY